MSDGLVRKGLWAAGWSVAAATFALACARLYDMNGRWDCYQETGDRFKGPYTWVYVTYLAALWGTLALTVLAGAVRPRVAPRMNFYLLPVCVSLLGSALTLGPCP